MSDLLDWGSLFPQRWEWEKPAPWYVDLVIIDWLEIEVDSQAQQKMPILETLAGHRNWEVYNWLHETREHRAAEISRVIDGG
jgi:succinate dehydrogenase flavin-adding protein (antitoxin of CptAB toxin-antitoxin module)